tara:strand:- start:15 stop:317 length:303 start_codon:yes stop_codon:yes gene_type:complete
MDRIRQSDLKYLAGLINQATNSPVEPWTRDETGKLTANIGNYYISGAYGGVSLQRNVNLSGGCTDVFNCGHVPKRDLYNRMRAYLAGLEDMDNMILEGIY